MRRFVTVAFILSVLFNSIIVQSKENIIKKYCLHNNESTIKLEINILNDDTEIMIPLRAFFEFFGGNVQWRQETDSILVDFDGMTYIFYVNNPDFDSKLYIKNETNDDNYFFASKYGNKPYIIADGTTYICQSVFEDFLLYQGYLFIVEDASIKLEKISKEYLELKRGNLYINDILIESDNGILFDRWGKMLLPLRTIFEALGANVTWDEYNEQTIINHDGQSYICYTQNVNPEYINREYFFIQNMQTKQYIFLNPMAPFGIYTTINDRIYLCQDAGIRLLQGLGYTIEIDANTKTVRIQT